jgi:polysaccharide pyruvyl transferase WcaK-like protein
MNRSTCLDSPRVENDSISRRLTSSAGPRFGLLGPYGAGNLGDAAIQDAVIGLIRSARPDAQFVAICPHSADAQARHGIDALPLTPAAATPSPPAWLRWLLDHPSRRLTRRLVRRLAWELHRSGRALRFLVETWRRLKRVDVLVISGGGQIDDFWGGPWSHPFSLALWTSLARLRGCPVIALSLGGTQLRHRLSRVFVRHALSLAQSRSFRDPSTRAFVATLGLPERDPVMPDLAFACPRPPRPNHRPTPPVLGICPIAADAWTHPDDPAAARLLDRLEALARDRLEHGWSINLFASQVVADRPVVEQLARRLTTSPHRGRLVRLRTSPVASVADFLNAAASVDLLVAARMHAVLLSFVAATPAIAICYDPKVRSLMSQVGLLPYALDLAEADAPRLAQAVDAAFAQRRQLAAQIESQVDAFRNQLSDHIAADVLPAVLPG